MTMNRRKDDIADRAPLQSYLYVAFVALLALVCTAELVLLLLDLSL
ncbi:hypothetical protein [Bordetella phage vB_BbrM_PHB04]|uniref:Uncharacterized protein n=1 Tax=Bordetella phage vB_BbrM_PHB04 TaxID=2029657 RepID=A0A291LA63_9CAUD|nr:hypothetical protein HOS14_gp086 [Bordetella phage vB_BbrM_PHB04]ATI15704.1 hypothetical protein [Bordetella phage vB_BbrM_PHB04]